MNCFPIARCLKSFGRILSKMLPTSNKSSLGWQRLNSDKTYLSSDSSPTHSSGYESSESKSYEPASDKIKIFKDQLNTSLDSLLSSIKSLELFTDNSNETTIDYSQLSIDSANEFYEPEIFHLYNNHTANLIAEHQAFHEELRRDFEMNGQTLEVEDVVFNFTPPISSTPLVNRRSHQQPQPSRQSNSNNETLRNRRMPKKKIKPNKKSLEDHCVFCKNNGAHESVYRKHTVKDAMGKVICPTLRNYKCPICGASGDKSHTVKYCPKKPIITMEDIERMDCKI